MKTDETRKEPDDGVKVDLVFEKGMGREGYDPDSDLQEFEENGLYGLKTPDGKVVREAEYDAIHKWPDADVIYTLKGSEYHYYNVAGEEILTDVPEIKGLDRANDLMPWFITEEQSLPYVIIMRPVEGPVSKRCCFFRGQWVELDRVRRADVKKLMKTDTAEFDRPFTYIYYGFEATSADEENPVLDCLKQLRSLGCYQSSWHYLTRVCVSPLLGEAERWTVVMLAMLHLDTQTPLCLEDLHRVSFGVDESLSAGEVKMTQIHYFNDRWPAPEELGYQNAMISGTLNELISARAAALTAIRENYLSEYLDDALADFSQSVRIPAKMYICPDVREAVRKMDWLKGAGYSTEAGIWAMVTALREDIDYQTRCKPSGDNLEDWLSRALSDLGAYRKERFVDRVDFDFAQTVEIAKWYCDNGESINTLRCLSTPLDVLLSIRKEFGKYLSESSLGKLEEITSSFKALGAKTSEELIKELGAENIVGYAYPWVDTKELNIK